MYFLNTFEDGRYWDQFLAFFDLMLHRKQGDGLVQPYFMEAFDITGDEDWEDIDEEFQEFMKEVLEMDLKPFSYTPPPREK